jgi:hypothetical protein
MNGKTRGNRSTRRAVTLAVPTAITLLVTGCGVVHVHFGSAPSSAQAAPVPYRVELAYAQCMRAHGEPSFPLPSPSGNSGTRVHLSAGPDSSAARAIDACEHLLPGG